MTGEFESVGLMETNPHKMILKFRDTAERLLMDKGEFAELIRGKRDTITIRSRDQSQTVLLGTVPEEYAGKAEVTRSGKAIRLNLKDGRTLYLALSAALKVLEKETYSCVISEVVA